MENANPGQQRRRYRTPDEAAQEHERIIAEYVEWVSMRDQSKPYKLKKHNALLKRCLMKCIKEYPELGELHYVKHTLEECSQ